MKKIKLVLMMGLCFSFMKSQTLPSSCIAPNALKTAYAKDIHELAVKYMYFVKTKDTVLVRVSQSWLDTIMQPLAAVYNCKGIPERDSVFNIYCVHDSYAEWGGHELYIVVDTNSTWAKQWKGGNTLTGNPQMDSMLTRYKLTLESWYDYPNFNSELVATFVTPDKLNLRALCDSLEAIPGVIYSEPRGSVGDRNMIIFSRTGNNRFLNFRLGWGDCPAGCTSQYIWKFKILPTCSVQYMGHTGSWSKDDGPLPSPVNCILNSVREKKEGIQCKIINFPNPSTEQINFEITGTDENAFSLLIYDALGRTVKRLDEIQSQKFTLDRNGMENGVYFYELRTTESKVLGRGKLMVE